jgi:LAS superfamily LD-carboxypeptidase LdcB
MTQLTAFTCFIAFSVFAIPAAASAAEPSCAKGPVAAAQKNTANLNTLAASPFHRAEQGWAVYAPLVQSEIGSKCAPNSPAFAASLLSWQQSHKLPANGAMDGATLEAMKTAWQNRRPFVVDSRHSCPPTPPEHDLATVPGQQSYGGKTIQLEQRALIAYEKMADAARKSGVLAAGSNLLSIFSGYRSPQYDDARCAKEHNCQGVVRASCSAHRTGLAMDVDLGAAPGFAVDSSDDKNRLYMSQTPLYRWLVANAARYGFANYAFEPWHWEFTGGRTS